MAVAAVVLASCGRYDFDVVADTIAPVSYRDAVLADAPIAYWRLDDPSSVATDTTGQIDGTYATGCELGVPGALADDPDTAVEFNGTTCEVMLPAALQFAMNSAMSIELWVLQPATDGKTHHFFTRETRNASDPIDGTHSFTAIRARPESTSSARSASPPLIALRWRSTRADYDGGAILVYIDGVLVSTTTKPTGSRRQS